MKLWSMVMRMSCALAGCAGSQSTNPGDMNATQHQTTAGQEQAAATAHARQYDPKAEQPGPMSCAATADVGSYYGGGGVCWTSAVNPTEQHRKDAQEHRELAEKHRAAAAALRDAEARACAGVTEQDRDTSPFYHREDITEVSNLDRTRERNEPGGARVVFRAVPGLTLEWLQRLVNCHRARAASVGYIVPEMGYCPLALKGVDAVVSSTGDGFAIEVTSGDFDTAREIQLRAALAQKGGRRER